MTRRVSHLIFLDKLFAPVYVICSWLIPFFFSKNDHNNKIVAIKFFGMGSIVRLASIMKNSELPTSQLELITLAKNREICELLGIKTHCIRSGNPFLMLKDLIGTLFLVWRMKKLRIIDLERTSNLSGIFRLIISIGNSCSSFTFNGNNSQSRNQTFISLNNKSAVQAIAEILQVKQRDNSLLEREAQGNKIVVNVNAGEYLPQRKYPINYFVEIIKELNQKEETLEFILTGSKKETAYTKQLADQLDQLGIAYKNTAGKLSLSKLIDLLRSSRLLITNDSGPLHLAYYYEVPVVAIWGPTSYQLVGYPDSNRMKNVSVEKACSPCFIHPKSKVAEVCSNRIDCLNELDPKKVLVAVSELSQTLDKFAVNVG